MTWILYSRAATKHRQNPIFVNFNFLFVQSFSLNFVMQMFAIKTEWRLWPWPLLTATKTQSMFSSSRELSFALHAGPIGKNQMLFIYLFIGPKGTSGMLLNCSYTHTSTSGSASGYKPLNWARQSRNSEKIKCEENGGQDDSAVSLWREPIFSK